MQNLSASTTTRIPLSRRANICLTSSSVSLLDPWRDPIGVLARPFRSRSAEFCFNVPRYICQGFTHGLTSQVCKTHSPEGIGPRNSSHDTRCAERVLPRADIRPYPILLMSPSHIQHPASGMRSILSSMRSLIDFAVAIAELLAELVIGQEPLALSRQRLHSL